MTLAQVEGFMAIIHAGAVKVAAGRLGIHERTLRERIEGLEAWLGKQLFYRKPSYRLTHHGHQFRQTADLLIRSLYDAREKSDVERLLELKGMTLEEIPGRWVTNAVTGETYFAVE